MSENLDPPVNCSVIDRDGLSWPVDLIYVGDEDGIAQWETVNLPCFIDEVRAVHVDVLPPRTSIRIVG